jgi:hypothetical protein
MKMATVFLVCAALFGFACSSAPDETRSEENATPLPAGPHPDFGSCQTRGCPEGYYCDIHGLCRPLPPTP